EHRGAPVEVEGPARHALLAEDLGVGAPGLGAAARQKRAHERARERDRRRRRHHESPRHGRRTLPEQVWVARGEAHAPRVRTSVPVGALRVTSVVIVVSAAVAARRAAASPVEVFGFGPRHGALAGAGVASTDDFAAVYYNPAGLALGTGMAA